MVHRGAGAQLHSSAHLPIPATHCCKPANNAGDLQLTSLDAYDNGAVMFTWLPVLVAALATLLLRAIPRGTGERSRLAADERSPLPAGVPPLPPASKPDAPAASVTPGASQPDARARLLSFASVWPRPHDSRTRRTR